MDEKVDVEPLTLDQIPSVTRAKRSADYFWPKRSSYNWSSRRPSSHYYKVSRRPPTYGFEGHVQDSYFRHNPFYLYSKLAYIEHKLKEKKTRASSKQGRLQEAQPRS